MLFIPDAEVLLVFQRLQQGPVGRAHRPALDGGKDLRGVETEHRDVAEARRALPVQPNAERVRRVVEDLQAVPGGESPDALHVADIAVHVHGQDRRRAFRQQGLRQRRVQGTVLFPDVAEHRHEAAAHDGVHRGYEGEGRGDDFCPGRQAQRAQGGFQRQVAVGEGHGVRNFQVLLQGGPERLVLRAHVGQDAAVPERTDLRAELLERRQRSAGDGGFLHRESDRKSLRNASERLRRARRRVMPISRGANRAA